MHTPGVWREPAELGLHGWVRWQRVEILARQQTRKNCNTYVCGGTCCGGRHGRLATKTTSSMCFSVA